MSHSHETSRDGVEKAFDLFMEQIKEREHAKKIRERTEKDIILQKSKVLVPIRKLLKRFQDMGIIVKNAETFAKELSLVNREPVLFRVYEDPSSKTWAPGVSIFFDHPAVIEIAVPNENQRSEHGVVVVTCASDHPLKYLLNGPHRSIDGACEALANFLAKNTEYVSRQWTEK